MLWHDSTGAMGWSTSGRRAHYLHIGRIAALWRHTILPFLGVLIVGAISLASSAQIGNRRMMPAIRQVDHILVQTDDPQNLFDFLTDTLQLPVAWPISGDSGYTSCGVGVGNVNLELFRRAAREDSPRAIRPAARFAGFAFEPHPLKDSLPQLQSRGISFDRPDPYVSILPNGSQGALWTTVVLPQFSRPNLSIFLFEYSRAFLNVDVRRKAMAGQLVLNKGGPLGIQAIKEIILGTGDMELDKSLWRKLFAPVPPTASGVWQPGNGPAIHLVQSATERIQRISLKVGALGRAKAFLTERHLLGRVSNQEISIHPAKIQGLNISLVEK
jgi:hypothetical protein